MVFPNEPKSGYLILKRRIASFVGTAGGGAGGRHSEGLVHGFLVLRALDGQILADGDLNQVARGGRVTSKLVFRFRDGSYHEETAVFSQSHYFQLITNHLVQRGPSFSHPIDMSIDTSQRHVTVRYRDDNGKEKVADERMDLPPDLANGLISI